MDTIIKIIKAIVIGDDGQVDKTAVQRLKEVVLWVLVGMAIMVGIALYIDDEEPDDDDDIELVDE